MTRAFVDIATPSPAIPPRRQSNLDRRTREYLTPAEVEKLLQASSKVGRHGARDRTLILLAYRRGLRVSGFVDTSAFFAHLSTTRIYEHRKTKPEDSPTFKVSY